MRALYVSAVAAFGVFAVACSPEPPKKAKVVMVGDSTPNKDTSSSTDKSKSKSGAETTTGSEDSTQSTSQDDTSSATDDTDSPSTDDPNTPPESTPQVQTKSCDASAEGNSSTTKVTYVVQNGSASVSSMTVAIANKNHRNKNDVEVYVTPSGGTESSIVHMKDSLPDGQTTTVTLPSNFSVTMGSKVRVETIFDDSFGDPRESCTLQF